MAIEIKGLSKTFKGSFQALDRVNLDIADGEMVALIGASGSGKSTLLRHISGLMPANATQSHIRVGGRVVQQDGVIARDVRNARADIGFIFQQFNLVGRLPVLTNVLSGGLARMPLWRSCFQHFTAAEKTLGLEALARVGIADHAYKKASALSGGQQQRAAIARTIVQRAKIILADEPIASLDPESARRVMQALATLNREDGSTVIVSLHQVDMAMRFCQRTVALHRGRVVYDGPSAALTPAMLRELYGAEAEDILSPAPVSQPQPQTASATDIHGLSGFSAAAA
ncbi:phosphonate ABC transporter ATP-binding protein [Noviherbaspirillum sp. Root189]|uniref:phosphonate ABC transporter ATP-binding protein n=1 Tax=Noviherbaspirillum sp. Root189 TaxID=1736487 RepID=UPI00071051EE|nr:phosphonate ABC transporter ATP-binding protein [Noviherbaspirillum sp. Root189]KRB93139.1 phosphonate/organophosphate ester transporter subunit [Noviherbaspirillum sp. Root189]